MATRLPAFAVKVRGTSPTGVPAVQLVITDPTLNTLFVLLIVTTNATGVAYTHPEQYEVPVATRLPAFAVKVRGTSPSEVPTVQLVIAIQP